MARADRPISPHLQVYRWYFTMALSILHRVTGAGLVVGLILLTWWLMALAAGEASFAVVHGLVQSWLGGLVLFGFTLILYYHLFNGIRHLVWDLGYGFEKETANRTGQAVVGATVVFTLLTWLLLLIVG